VENLYQWSGTAARAVGVPEWAASRESVAAILDLAKVTAHGVARPAAPVASFLAGVAVGLAGAAGPAELERVRGLIEATVPAADDALDA
jgi:hypothetical protein